MKRVVLILLAALLIGGVLGALVARDPGYILVAYDGLSVETSLWFGVVFLVVGYFLLRLASVLWRRFMRSGPGLLDWNRERRARTARKQTVQGLLLAAEGRWQEAHKLLVASSRDALMPLVNFLYAAGTAQHLGHVEERDQLLSQAAEATPGSKVALGLTRADMQLGAGQVDQALAGLLELRRESPRHPAVLKTLLRCYEELGDAQAMLELIPELTRHKALPAAELETAIRHAGVRRLTGLDPTTADQFDTLWDLLPKPLRHDPALAAAGAGVLAENGREAEAERLVADALGQHWDDRLVDFYGRLTADPAKQLGRVEKWLKDRTSDPVVLLAAGRLAFAGRAWDKAREYFEASLRSAPTSEVYIELARVCLELGDSERAGSYLGRIPNRSSMGPGDLTAKERAREAATHAAQSTERQESADQSARGA